MRDVQRDRAVLVLATLILLSAWSVAAAAPGSNAETFSSPSMRPQLTPTLGPLPAVAPALPFADNPDPNACGIPVRWLSSAPAWVTGAYEGRLVQPVVYLHDSHLRRAVIGQIPHGGRIEISLSQSNPVLNYYRVRSLDLSPAQEGWIPAPFVSFEQPDVSGAVFFARALHSRLT